MTDQHKSSLRSIMLIAWDFRRADPARTFADCLRGSWAWSKRMAKHAAKFMKRAAKGGVVRLSPDLTRSPIRRSLRGQRYEGQKAYQAAYATAVLGR